MFEHSEIENLQNVFQTIFSGEETPDFSKLRIDNLPTFSVGLGRLKMKVVTLLMEIVKHNYFSEHLCIYICSCYEFQGVLIGFLPIIFL